MENDSVLSPESEELSDENSDDDYLFEDSSDTDFSNVEELEKNDARSETNFAESLNSVVYGNETAIRSNFGVGVSRNDMLGAWGLRELKIGGLDQKFCNASHMVDETQMCTTECTVDILENWTSSGGIDRQKGQRIRRQMIEVISHSWKGVGGMGAIANE